MGGGAVLSVQVFKCRIGGGLDPEVLSFPFFPSREDCRVEMSC